MCNKAHQAESEVSVLVNEEPTEVSMNEVLWRQRKRRKRRKNKVSRARRYAKRQATMARRRRHQLRKFMLSFDPPEVRTVYRRIIAPTDLSEGSGEDDYADVEPEVGVSGLGENCRKSRKRARNEENWKRNKIKRARERGDSYVNGRGVTVPAKHAAVDQNLCRTKCRFHCNDKLDCRQSIFGAYYDMTSSAKDAYLF